MRERVVDIPDVTTSLREGSEEISTINWRGQSPCRTLPR
jgi:hypothetical protein